MTIKTKTCNKCNKTLPATNEFFNSRADCAMGLCPQCKTCLAELRQLPEAKLRRKKYLEEYKKDPKNKHRKSAYDKKLRENQAWRDDKRKYFRSYKKARKQNDPQYAIAEKIQSQTIYMLKYNATRGQACESLGCTSEFLKSYLETFFTNHPETGEPMTWENRGAGAGKWQIHHKEPKISFDLTDPEQLTLCAHWTNVEPIWYCEHLAKHETR